MPRKVSLESFMKFRKSCEHSQNIFTTCGINTQLLLCEIVLLLYVHYIALSDFFHLHFILIIFKVCINA